MSKNEYFSAVAQEEAEITHLRREHQTRMEQRQALQDATLKEQQAISDRDIAAFDAVAAEQVFAEKEMELKERKKVLATLEKKTRGQARSIANLKGKKELLLSRVRLLEQEASVLTLTS